MTYNINKPSQVTEILLNMKSNSKYLEIYKYNIINIKTINILTDLCVNKAVIK